MAAQVPGVYGSALNVVWRWWCGGSTRDAPGVPTSGRTLELGEREASAGEVAMRCCTCSRRRGAGLGGGLGVLIAAEMADVGVK